MAKPIILNVRGDYQAFQEKFLAQVAEVNSQTAVATWELGELFNEYVGDKEERGKAVVARLAGDLVEKGVSNTVSSAQSLIYVSARINRRFSRVKVLDLTKRGASVTHLKMLAALTDDRLVEAVLNNMLVDSGDGESRVVPTRALPDIITDCSVALGLQVPGRSTQKLAQLVEADDVSIVVDESPEDDEADLLTDVQPQYPGMPTASHPAGSPSDEVDTEGDSDNLFAGGEAHGKADVKSNDNAGAGVRDKVDSPLRTLKDFEKAATRLQVLVADALIALEQADKTGFDGERQQENFNEAFNLAKVSARDVQGPLAELISRMGSYDFSGDVPE